MNIVTVRDLRERPSKLVDAAGAGEISVVIKRGQPVLIAIPASDQLLQAMLSAMPEASTDQEELCDIGAGASVPSNDPEPTLKQLLRRLYRQQIMATNHAALSAMGY